MIVKIEQFVTAYYKMKAPFNWKTTVVSTLDKLQRYFSKIYITAH
jgi:hypothetical protein